MSGNIYIIEDDVNTVDIVRTALTPLGVTLHHFQTGQEAIISMRQQQPNLIIVDLRLPAPSITGIEIVQRIKNDDFLAQIPIIVITASGADGIMKVMKAGCDAYLEKPFAIGHLRRMVSRYLSALT